MDTNNLYYTIVGTSRNTSGGPRYTIGAAATEQDIIGFAYAECARSGETLEEIAGIGWKMINEGTDDELVVSERDFVPGEEFQAALAKLNDDGRAYEIFDSETETAEFIARAEQLGIGDLAREAAGVPVIHSVSDLARIYGGGIITNDRGNGCGGPGYIGEDEVDDQDDDLDQVAEEQDPDAWRLAREAAILQGLDAPTIVCVGRRDFSVGTNPHQTIYAV